MQFDRGTNKVVFVTGTDTGVGKTVLTAMLLHFLRQRGIHALAMKPFCSGDRGDVEILAELQDGELGCEEINPYFFPEPVAPIASKAKKNLSVSTVMKKIRQLEQRCDVLLVEGCGGVNVPISRNFLLSDLIGELQCPTILVGANRLGVLNHTLLSVEALRARGITELMMALMEPKARDASAGSNQTILSRLLRPVPVFSIGNLGKKASETAVVRKNSEIIQKLVAHGQRHAYFPAAR